MKELMETLSVLLRSGDSALLKENERNINKYLHEAQRELTKGEFQQAWLWLVMGKIETGEKEIIQSLLKKYFNFIKLQKPIRVLHGSIEIANQMATISKGLETDPDILSHTVNYYPYYLNYSSTYTWNLLNQRSTKTLNRKLREFSDEICCNYNVLHFHFGTTLTFDYSDLSAYKSKGIPALMHHWGSDVRQLSLALKTNPYARVKDTNEEGIKRKLEVLGSFISHCIIPDWELYPYVKDYYGKVEIVPSVIDVSAYPCNTENEISKRPLIVHAPTSPYIKGTPSILKAVEDLKLTHAFDFELVQGLSHKQAVETYKKADIIVDQLHIGSYGLFAVECMALGKPVVCWITDEMKSRYPKDLPLITANPDTIKETLKKLLDNRDSLKETGNLGRAYIEQVHDCHKVKVPLKRMYSELLN
ncbi:glycosyltransferase [Metabacillus indicus]|uniref:glycosyltransferase n=1 Tax=Metabacillus indicus TaxID=246786 RepID=UPI00068AC75E|nr:glycosyltransferase [Metabacillus indicus]